MARVQVQYPDMGNVLATAEAIKGNRIRNRLAEAQLEDLPKEKAWREEQRTELRKQWAEQAEDRVRRMSREDATDYVQSLETASRLLQGVNDQESYGGALYAYANIYGDNALRRLQLPKQYDPELVATLQDYAITAAARAKMVLQQLPKLGTTRTVQKGGQKITQEHVGGGQYREIGRGPAWKPEAGGPKVPDRVVKAQQLVLKFTKDVDPMMAALIAANPAMANSPIVKQALETQIPKNLRPAYDNAIKILSEHYQVDPVLQAYPDAYQGTDGQWYVERDGKTYRVEKE